MSYILDALRKSEHERQMATGQNVGLTFTVGFKRDTKPWLISAIIVFTGLILLGFIWWMWSQPLVTKAINTIQNLASTYASQSKTIDAETLPEYVVKTIDLTHESSPKQIHKINPVEKQPKLPDHAEIAAQTKTVIGTEMKSDPLKDLPPLNISGYMHEEQGGSIAMINNQLVHEGEEVSPGLKLVKILGDSAIFSYKGYVFSR